MTQYTLTYSEKNKGWTSFHDWFPSLICGLNNKFFTIKNGQLFEHYDRDNPQRNNFYGVKHESKVITVLNEYPSEDKIVKNIIQESTRPWQTTIETNLANGVINASEFNQRESKWMAHTRKNESSSIRDRHQGIGNILQVDSNNITFDTVPELVSIGEILYQVNSGVPEEVGAVDDIQGNVIIVNTIINTPIINNFAYTLKNARIQGAEIRGYYAKLTLTNSDDENVELFAVHANIARSHAPTQHR